MWDFLALLYEKYWDVLDWFWYRYWGAVDLLNNFWNWIEEKAWYYYEKGKTYAIEKFNEVSSSAWTWVENAKNDAWAWIDNAKSDAWAWVENAKDTARGWVDAAKDWAWDTIEWAKAELYGALDWLKATLETAIDWAIDTVVSWAQAAVDLVPSMQDLVTAFAGTTLGRLLTVAVDWWEDLGLFMADPLGFILAYLKPIFITFFCYAMAYALGTEVATLPAWPVWGTGGGDPPTDQPFPPPPGAGKLGRPLEPLYISGYTFREGHRAVDFGLANGQAVYATHSGVIETVAYDAGGLGNYLTIRGTSWWTLYAHLQAAQVSGGQAVSTGERIAAGDDTGMSTGPHLHFACKYNGEYVDPVLAM